MRQLFRSNWPDHVRHNRRWASVLVLALLYAMLVPADMVVPTPTALAQAGAPPQFLRDLPELRGWIDDSQDWAVGGGFLYWSRCEDSGPRLNSASGAAVLTGYLRRWPIGGGRVVTLSNAATCTAGSMAADASGLYYYDNGTIKARLASDPLNARTVGASGVPSGRIVLDTGDTFWGDYIFWIADGVIRNARKSDLAQAGRPEPAAINAQGLMLDGEDLLWSGDGQIRSIRKYCLAVGGGACVKTPLVGEPGNYLLDARLQGTSLGTSARPLWVNGASIRGYTCRFTSTGLSCGASTWYNGPVLDGTPYKPGRLASDGTFLFWVENTETCGPLFCSLTDNGRLMKMSLNQSALNNSPFTTAQPIACRDCFANYVINNGGGQIAVAGGWVYFNTSNGISRIRADAPAISWDLSVTGIEVTQSVQNLNNDVPLVAHKPTYVRLYGNKLNGLNISSVDARLYGRAANGAALPGSPLSAINGTQAFAANNAALNRAQTNGGWLFQLPDSWTNAGTARLSAQIDPRNVWNDSNRANNTLAERTFNFTNKAPICIVTIPVRTHAPAASYNDPSLPRMVDVLKRIMPTSDVWLYHQDNDVAQLEGRFGIPPWKYEPYAIPAKGDNVLNALALRGALSDDPDRCDDVGAITHYVGLVHAQTPTGNNLGKGQRPGDALYIKLVDPSNFAAVDWRVQDFNTLAHELSHNYDRKHVNCGGSANNDTAFPYPDGSGTNCMLDNGALTAPSTHFGFDINSLTPIAPDTTADYMAYRAPYWASDYTWKAIFNRLSNTAALASASQSLQSAQAELAAAGDVVYISGVVTPGQNQGALDYAWNFPTTMLSQGIRHKLQRSAAPRFSLAAAPVPAANAYHLRLLDAQNVVLDDRTITPNEAEDGETTSQGFTLSFPAPGAQVARIELLDGATVLATLQPGASKPLVSMVSPAGGETFDTSMKLAWRAADPDASDKLLFTVQYSPDNGATWRALLANFPNLSSGDAVSIDLKDISGLPASTAGGLIRVAASDGYNTGFGVSQPFTVPNRAPEPVILSPGNKGSVPAGQPVLLRGSASDAEDGGLSGMSLGWTLDGKAVASGAEATLAGLAPGSYQVVLTARDSAGRAQTASTTLTVDALVIPAGVAPTLDGSCVDESYAGAARVQLAPYSDGTQASVQLLRTDTYLWACFTGMNRTGGSSPGTMVGLRADINYSRDATPQTGDYLFTLGENGVPNTYGGNAGSYGAGPGGMAGQVNASGSTWSAEMRIDASVLGGWNHVIGLDVEQPWLNAVGDDYFWPYAAAWDKPNTWATTALGDLPQITAISPASASAGAPALTLTVNGTNFAAGAVVRWNGADRPTTILSSTQAQATISAADLAQAGTAAVTIANPGTSSAPSNALPFFIGNPASAPAGSGTRVMLPVVRR